MQRIIFWKIVAANLALAFLLTGCGGGGSDAPASTPAPMPMAFLVSPTSVTSFTGEGASTTFTTTLTLNTQVVTGPVYVGFTDSGDATDSNALFHPTSNTTASITFNTLASLSVGTHTGRIDFYACKDGTCSSVYSEVPVSMNYTITVTQIPPLDPVPTPTGLPEWSTYQGNAGHTGYVPVTLNSSHFVAQWSWTNPDSSGGLTPVTTGSGKVVVAGSGYFSPAYLYALNESDGSLDWHYDFGSIFAVNHPAVADGRVFVASSGHSDTFMWSFDINDGTLKYKTAFDSQWDHYLAPVVANGYVYTDGGTSGGMYRFIERTGSLSWIGSLSQYDLWSPAVDGHYAYAYTGHEFAALDIATGARAFTVNNSTFNWSGYSLNIAPVLPGDGSVVVVDGVYAFLGHPNHLIRYSIAGQDESWRVDGSFASDPVVANGILYVLNAAANSLEARSLSSGQLLWSWVPSVNGETISVSNLVLTDNLVFVSTSSATRAIDLSTRQSVWSNAHTGHLALSSNKMLYIVSNQRIDAINLN